MNLRWIRCQSQHSMKTISQFSILGLKLVALVVMLYSISLLGLRLLGFDFSVVLSDSMSPLVKTGDLVILDSHEEFFAGDIIQFESHKIKVLHRIVGFEKGKIRTKGDANIAKDPVLVERNQIDGVAIGTLRGFGIPILLFRNFSQTIFSQAKFSKQLTWKGVAGSNIWINPTVKWKVPNSNDVFTFVAPSSVTSTGVGNRTVLMSKVISTDKYFYSLLKLTAKDSINATIYILSDACTSASQIICGWAIGLADTTNTISVSTYSTSGTRSSAILQKSWPIDLTVDTKLVLYSNTEALKLFMNDVKALEILQPASFAQSKNVTVPGGNYFGIVTVNSNQFRSSKSVTW